MKQIVFIVLLIVPFILKAQSTDYKKMLSNYYDDFPTIAVDDAKVKVGSSNVYFLDTRELTEYNVSHIKGAKFVGYDLFKIENINHIPKNAEIIVYCSVGARSQTIGKKLKKAGYTNVRNLYGGLFHWSNKKLPLVNNKEILTDKIHGYSPEWGKWITHGDIIY